MDNILKHKLNDDPTPPLGYELGVAELMLTLSGNSAIIYTKNKEGVVIEIGKGTVKFSDLEDVEVATAKQGDFLVKSGNNFISTGTIGGIDRLSDVEITAPQNGQYLRWDSVVEAYRNGFATYKLSDLTDVDVLPADDVNANQQNNKVLYFDFPAGKWKARNRINLLDELVDVVLTPTTGTVLDPHRHQILSLDAAGTIWSNQDLQIVRDTSPELGGNLNGNGKTIYNSFFKVETITANTPTYALPYTTADYWIINGVPVGTQPQCILLPSIIPANNTMAVMMLEIRQSTGQILLGGLTNVKYEDGKAIQLSGNGKTDIITIMVENVNTVITTYIVANLLNLATVGAGGVPAYRYDKNRYPEVQFFDTANLYDDFYRDVELLLNMEEQPSKNKLWEADKSKHNHPVVNTGVTNLDTPIYTFGIQNYVAEFDNAIDNFTVTPASAIVLAGNFTLELNLNYEDSAYYESATVDHGYFESTNLSLTYSGTLTDTTQDLKVTVIIGATTYIFENANRLFRYQNTRYIHIALVRSGTTVNLWVDGELLTEKTNNSTNSPVTSISITSATVNTLGIMDSLRLTKRARYVKRFLPPALRFGLLGGLEDILPTQIFNTYNRGVAYQMFS